MGTKVKDLVKETAGINPTFLHFIDDLQGIPPRQYGYPETCRHCGCKLNRYNPLDVCSPCQEACRKGSPRAEIQEQVTPEEINRLVNIIQKKGGPLNS